MKLAFHAKGDDLVAWPTKRVGQYQYVGRRFDPETRQNIPLAEPVVVDDDSEDGKRLALLCRRDGALWPADAATAAVCGQAFVALEQDADGFWVPSASAKKAAQKGGS